jgi:hypothetical protein
MNNNEKKKLDPLKQDEIKEEMEIIRDLWKDLGVTDEYKQKFELLAKIQNNNDNIKKMLKNEKNQLKKLRNSLMILSKEVNARENEIEMIKMLDNIYYEIQLEKEKNIENLDDENYEGFSDYESDEEEEEEEEEKSFADEYYFEDVDVEQDKFKTNNDENKEERPDEKDEKKYLDCIDFKKKEKILTKLKENDYLKNVFKKYKDFNDILILIQKGIESYYKNKGTENEKKMEIY